MSENKDYVEKMSAVKMPIDSIQFLKKNPKIEKMASKLMCALIQITGLLKETASIYTAENFKGGLENGTQEELEKFVKDSLAALSDAETFDNLPKGTFERVKSRLSKNTLISEILVSEP